MRNPKSNIDPAEKTKALRAIMEWVIDDYATADIITKVTTTWKINDREARSLMAEAREFYAKSDELQEQILERRIEGLKKAKRGMSDADKKTPYGISVLVNIDAQLLRYETLVQSIRDHRKRTEERKKKVEKLTPKQELFCLEYIKDRNGTQAAIAAGYSENTAKEQASRLLRQPQIRSYIDDLLEDVRKDKVMDSEIALNELIAMADWNIQDFITEDNTIVDLSTLPKCKTKPVVALKSSETITKDGEIKRVTELKLVDKRAAWVDINRHFGNFEKDNMQKPGAVVTAQHMSDDQFATLLNKINGSTGKSNAQV